MTVTAAEDDVTGESSSAGPSSSSRPPPARSGRSKKRQDSAYGIKGVAVADDVSKAEVERAIAASLVDELDVETEQASVS